MNETCDRCGPTVHAMFRVERDAELYLCRHCVDRLWQALYDQGWTIWATGEQACAGVQPATPTAAPSGPAFP
jgi:hypothetical protein